MIIYMKHPEHGRIPCMPDKVEDNQKYGYVIDENQSVQATPERVPDEVIPPQAFKRKPGRPRKEAQ